MEVAQNQPAPTFSLQDQAGTTHKLEDYQGSWVVLYFYPKDDTPGCTTQACDIRDQWSTFKQKGITVLGVSPDTVESHAKFAEKYDLPFTILADPDKEVAKKYGAWQEKKMFGKIGFGIQRSTVLIDPEGRVAKVYKRVQAKKHADKVLKDLSELMAA